MTYSIKITNYAIYQMEETVSYISKTLLAPETAAKWLDRMKSEIAALHHMPSRIPLTEEEPWRSYGIHKMGVQNFLIYFWIDEEAAVVWVTAVVYGRRNQRGALEAMPL